VAQGDGAAVGLMSPAQYRSSMPTWRQE
jgi:hypothetical protein